MFELRAHGWPLIRENREIHGVTSRPVRRDPVSTQRSLEHGAKPFDGVDAPLVPRVTAECNSIQLKRFEGVLEQQQFAGRIDHATPNTPVIERTPELDTLLTGHEVVEARQPDNRTTGTIGLVDNGKR